MDIFELVKTIVLSGAATVIATQILKNPFIPIPFEQFPRLTAGIISLGSSGIALWQANGSIFTSAQSFWDWIAVSFAVLFVAITTYSHLLKPTGSKTVL